MVDRSAALEEVRIVREMIESTRQSLRGAWIPFAVFGLLGIAAAVASHAMLDREMERYIWVPWLLFVTLGLAGSLTAMRGSASDPVQTFVGRLFASLWFAIGITLTGLWVAALVMDGTAVALPATAMVVGLGVFVSGKLVDYAPMAWSALPWWLGGLLMTVLPSHGFVIEAVLLTVAYLLPAWGMYRQETQGSHA